MRRYFCPTCANEVHFDNTVCVKCDSKLGYVSSIDRFLVSSANSPTWTDAGSEHACANRDVIGCNWLVEGSGALPYCTSCRHTLIIPDLSTAQNIDRWARLERAKRMLFYALHKFHLPLPEQSEAPLDWLRFEFKADLLSFNGQQTSVKTGHEGGLITINVAEADDDVRERHRVAMGEPYRTLIGHFRHEVGHYYWDRLVADGGQLDGFRAMFGDERIDYEEALSRHYQSGAPPGWEKLYVSSYASSHPWEDFAETWAHYFHITDGLETAQSYAIGTPARSVDNTGSGAATGPYESRDFNVLINAWVPLTIAMNAMNRSIGNSDFYPFVLSDAISAKLQFIHDLIHGN
jgi:hypothetical protein